MPPPTATSGSSSCCSSAGLKKGLDTAVGFAVRGCYTDIVRALVSRGAPIAVTLQGSPAIVLAAGENCTGTLAFLLERGADVNARAADGTTPLIAAAQRGLVTIGEMLIAKGADMELRNKEEQNAWLLAAMSNHLEFVELLRRTRDKNESGIARDRFEDPEIYLATLIWTAFRNFTGTPFIVAGR